MIWLLSEFLSIMLPLAFLQLFCSLSPLKTWSFSSLRSFVSTLTSPWTTYPWLFLSFRSEMKFHTLRDVFPDHPIWNRPPTLNFCFLCQKICLYLLQNLLQSMGVLFIHVFHCLFCVTPISHSLSLKPQCLSCIRFLINTFWMNECIYYFHSLQKL